jgi:diguanylate cyclase (GGDEF)-like protein
MDFGGMRPAASMPASLPSWYRTPPAASLEDDLGGLRRRADPPKEAARPPFEEAASGPFEEAASPSFEAPMTETPVEPSALPEPVDEVTVLGGVGVVDLPSDASTPEAAGVAPIDTPEATPIGVTGDALPFIDDPTGWTDAFSGLDGPIYWARLVSGEGARIRRYHRPATIVLFEVVALDRLARQWGEDVALQSLLRVARMLSRHIRSSDHAARIGAIRFGAYLPETNEIAAINFVERCRAAILRDLGTAGEIVTLAIGWAEPIDGDLDAAVAVAETRLAKEIEAAP